MKIDVILGGCLAGKSTYVKKTYLGYGFELKIWDDVPVSVGPHAAAVGDYGRSLRGSGFDQVAHRKGAIDRVVDMLFDFRNRTPTWAVEGHALQSKTFMEGIKGIYGAKNIRLILLNPSVEEVRRRATLHRVKWNDLVLSSYRSAFKVWSQYKGEFEHEIRR